MNGTVATLVAQQEGNVARDGGSREPVQILSRCRDRDIEVARQPLPTVCLDRNPADSHVFDFVARERLEQLARVKGVLAAHELGVRPFTAASPARNSDATVFQFKASSNRSDIGRRRASMTASGTASGSRAASLTRESARRVGSSDEPTKAAYRPSRTLLDSDHRLTLVVAERVISSRAMMDVTCKSRISARCRRPRRSTLHDRRGARRSNGGYRRCVLSPAPPAIPAP